MICAAALAVLLVSTGQFKQAEEAYRNALSLQEQLVAEFPAVPDYRSELALSHNNLGGLLISTGQLQHAEVSFRDALAIQKQLTADFPALPGYRKALAD